MTYYVYLYLNTMKSGDYHYNDLSFEYEPIYCGMGKGRRAYSHLKGNKYNPYLHNTINKMSKLGYKPTILFIEENIDQINAKEIEKNIIKCIGRKDLKQGPLLNLTDGGDGKENYITSTYVKEKISNNEKLFYKLNPHKKIEMSIRQKKIFENMSNEEYEKYCLSRKNIMEKQETRDKIRIKALERYEKIENRKIMSESKKLYYSIHPEHKISENCTFEGRKHSEETKRKMREARARRNDNVG